MLALAGCRREDVREFTVSIPGLSETNQALVVSALDKYEDAIDHILVRDIPEGFCRRLERFTPDWYEIVSDHYPAYIDVAY